MVDSIQAGPPPLPRLNVGLGACGVPAEGALSPLVMRVLVVEDEPEARALLSREIADCGYQTTAVADAQLAMEIMAREEQEIVVADIRLPGMDGLEVLQRIRRESDVYGAHLQLGGGGKSGSKTPVDPCQPQQH